MDDKQKNLEISDSKCNTCKFGVCLKDTDTQSFFHPVTVEPNAFDDDQTEGPAMSQMEFHVTKVRSLCFWRPDNMSTPVVPVSFGCIRECSRYEL